MHVFSARRKREALVVDSSFQLLLILDVADDGTASLHRPIDGNSGKNELHQFLLC